MSQSDPQPANPTPATPESAGVTPADEAQLKILVDAARSVATALRTTGRSRVSIQPKQAEHLQRIPYQLLDDITRLAIRRTQMRNHEYLEIDDIDWAWSRLVVGKRSNVLTTIFITVGALIAGAGIPILLLPLVTNSPITAAGILVGTFLTLPGLVLLSIALTLSVLRR